MAETLKSVFMESYRNIKDPYDRQESSLTDEALRQWPIARPKFYKALKSAGVLKEAAIVMVNRSNELAMTLNRQGMDMWEAKEQSWRQAVLNYDPNAEADDEPAFDIPQQGEFPK